MFIMPRPKKQRWVRFEVGVKYFKPAGTPMRFLQEVRLTHDEVEALRLKYYEDLEQEEAAKKMNVSRPTFHRILRSALKKITDFLINGKALRVEGGNYRVIGNEVIGNKQE